MNIQRQVAAVHRQSAVMAELQFLKHRTRPSLESGPKHAVVHDEQIRARGCGLAHHRQRCVDGGDDFGDLAVSALELQAIERRRVVRDLRDAQFGVEVGDEVREFHNDRLGSF